MRRQIWKIILFAGIWLGCSSTQASAKTKFIPAGDEAFQYMGRVQLVNDTALFNWPGVTVSVDFTGVELGIRIKGGKRNYFNVRVDNQPEEIFRAVNDTVWWFPGKLSGGIHHLRLVKRTEGEMGMAGFSGIYIGYTESVRRPEPLPVRKILFIGNSITCGYGVEGKNKAEHFKPSTENCEKSYATIIARAFGSQYQLASHSGLGMVRNYGDPKKLSVKRKPMPARLDYFFDEDSTRKYDLKNYIPDAVVINLGTNDFSTKPVPDKTDFIDAGEKLIFRLLDIFPGIKIFCITGPMTNEPCFSYTKEMVESVRKAKKAKDVVFVGVPVDLLNPEKDLGSDSHPSYRGQLKSANLIIPVMGTVLDWNFSLDEISENLKEQK